MSAYTQGQEAIRQSFANYLGALINASPYTGEIKKENVIALLSEELVKYSIDEDDKIDIKAAKPILKSALWILKKYELEILNDANAANINITNSEAYLDLTNLAIDLDNYIKYIE